MKTTREKLTQLNSDLGFQQLISKATNMIGQSKSSIYMILKDQPNMFIESGIYPSLHEQCHHQQIINGKLSLRNVVPHFYTRKLW